MIRHLDLFSGIGGFALAVRWLGGRTIGFCEIDPWCRRVLSKNFPEVPQHDDIRTLTGATVRGWAEREMATIGLRHAPVSRPASGRSETGTPVRDEAWWPEPERRDSGGSGAVDLITGGYPCQPFSLAGRRLGAEDDRHLWPEMRRVIDECRPRFVLAENVAGHVNMGLDVVLSDLEADGYDCGTVVIPAGAVNALHRRDRVWIMAHAEGGTRVPAAHGGRSGEGGSAWLEAAGSGGGQHERDTDEAMGHADLAGLEGRLQRVDGTGERSAGPAGGERCEGDGQVARALDACVDGLPPDLVRSRWADGSWEHGLPRVVAHEPDRRQKLQAAGNAIVPVLACEILKVMLEES